MRNGRRNPGATQLQRRERIHADRLRDACLYQTLNKSTPISDHVFVDFELRGCPINKHQLVEVISAFLQDRKPNTPPHSVCASANCAAPFA